MDIRKGWCLVIERVYTPRQHALFHLYGEAYARIGTHTSRRRLFLKRWEQEHDGSLSIWRDPAWEELMKQQADILRAKEDICTRLVAELGCKRYGVPNRWGEWRQRGGEAEYEKLEASGQVPDLPEFRMDPDVAEPPAMNPSQGVLLAEASLPA